MCQMLFFSGYWSPAEHPCCCEHSLLQLKLKLMLLASNDPPECALEGNVKEPHVEKLVTLRKWVLFYKHVFL